MLLTIPKALTRALLPAVSGLLLVDTHTPVGWEHPRFHLAGCNTPNAAVVTSKTKPSTLMLCNLCMHVDDETVVGNLLRCASSLRAATTSTRSAFRQMRRFPGRHVSGTTIIESRTSDSHVHRVLVDSYSNPSQRKPGAFDAAQDAITTARSSAHATDLEPLVTHVEAMLVDARSARADLREQWLRRSRPRRSQPHGTRLAVFRRDDLRPALYTTEHMPHRDVVMTLTVTDPVAVLWDSEYTGNDLYAYLVPEHQSLAANLDSLTRQPTISVPTDVDPEIIQVFLSLLPSQLMMTNGMQNLLAATAAATA